jgi:hypothetical protein
LFQKDSLKENMSYVLSLEEVLAELIESIKEEEYRCVLSNRPMTPCDGNYYEQSALRHILPCQVNMSFQAQTEGNELRVQGKQSNIREPPQHFRSSPRELQVDRVPFRLG